MKDELQSKLVEILTAIQSAAGQAGDFAMTQLPDIAQSYVMYGRAITTLSVIVGLAVLVATAYIAWRLGRRHGFTGLEPMYLFPLCISGVLLFNTGPMLLVWFAPKVWLLKEIAGLLK